MQFKLMEALKHWICGLSLQTHNWKPAFGTVSITIIRFVDDI